MGYIFLRKKYNSKEGYVMKSIFGRYPQNIDKRIKTQWAMGYFFAIRKSIAEKGRLLCEKGNATYFQFFKKHEEKQE